MKWLKALTFLFPASFRHRYGRDLVRDITEMHREIQQEKGPWQAGVYLSQASADVLRVVLHEHVQEGIDMLKTQPTRMAPLLFALSLTVSGVLFYGHTNYLNETRNPPALRWMDPSVEVQEVTTQPQYASLVRSIEKLYHPTEIKIWEVEINRGFLRGSRRVLKVAALVPQLSAGLDQRTEYETLEQYNKIHFQPGLVPGYRKTLEQRTLKFRQQIAGLVTLMDSHSVDAREFCVASPVEEMTITFSKQPGQKARVYRNMEAVSWMPIQSEMAENIEGRLGSAFYDPMHHRGFMGPRETVSQMPITEGLDTGFVAQVGVGKGFLSCTSAWFAWPSGQD